MSNTSLTLGDSYDAVGRVDRDYAAPSEVVNEYAARLRLAGAGS